MAGKREAAFPARSDHTSSFSKLSLDPGARKRARERSQWSRPIFPSIPAAMTSIGKEKSFRPLIRRLPVVLSWISISITCILRQGFSACRKDPLLSENRIQRDRYFRNGSAGISGFSCGAFGSQGFRQPGICSCPGRRRLHQGQRYPEPGGGADGFRTEERPEPSPRTGVLTGW